MQQLYSVLKARFEDHPAGHLLVLKTEIFCVVCFVYQAQQIHVQTIL
jgi:hypothetical protein